MTEGRRTHLDQLRPRLAQPPRSLTTTIKCSINIFQQRQQQQQQQPQPQHMRDRNRRRIRPTRVRAPVTHHLRVLLVNGVKSIGCKRSRPCRMQNRNENAVITITEVIDSRNPLGRRRSRVALDWRTSLRSMERDVWCTSSRSKCEILRNKKKAHKYSYTTI